MKYLAFFLVLSASMAAYSQEREMFAVNFNAMIDESSNNGAALTGEMQEHYVSAEEVPKIEGIEKDQAVMGQLIDAEVRRKLTKEERLVETREVVDRRYNSVEEPRVLPEVSLIKGSTRVD